jgi:Mg2+ and Co2+ transporter CorA
MGVRLVSDAGVERRPIDQLGALLEGDDGLVWVDMSITALSSIYGMNVIVNDRTRPVQLAVVLVVMAAMSATLLRWARRQGWW